MGVKKNVVLTIIHFAFSILVHHLFELLSFIERNLFGSKVVFDKVKKLLWFIIAIRNHFDHYATRFIVELS